MSATVPSSGQLAIVTYLSGVAANGTLAATSYWTWNNNAPATYSTTSSAHKWSNATPGVNVAMTSSAGTAGGTVTYAFDPNVSWTTAEQQAFIASLTLWSDEANIKFALVTNSSTADVLLTLNSGGGSYEQAADSENGTVGSSKIPDELTGSNSSQAVIAFDTSGGFGTLGSFTAAAGYSYTTLVHEAGHLLGLGHSGPYDDGSAASNEDADQESAFDSRQWSVMSYVDPSDTSAAYYSQYTVTGTDWSVSTTSGNETTTYEAAPETPMMLDILAAQRLYGTSTSTALAGGQIFGFNCNITDASEPFFDFTKNVDPVITIWDAGGGNTLDLSGYTMACTADLLPGTFSSVGGLTNNVGIAFGTTIDTAIGGSGNDIFDVNADADTINGGGGSNTVVFAGDASQYTMRQAGGTVTVALTATGVTDTLSNIQDLQFADRTVPTDSLPCFAAGTAILTPAGPVPVETLRPGATVIVCRGGARESAPVRWTGHRRIDLSRHPRPETVHPVRIAAGAFAPGAPARDLFLSPEHAVFTDGVLIPVKHLVNDATIAIEPCRSIEYWHVELDRHDVLLAENLPCESYLDTGTRDSFAGGPLTRLHADFAPAADCAAIWEAHGCADLVIAGEQLDTVAARLRRRAIGLGRRPGPAPPRLPSLRGRTVRPADLLDAAFYYATYADVVASGLSAAAHYAGWGAREGRLPCPEPALLRGLGLVDSGTVHAAMADVIEAGLDPVAHFCHFGWRERRRPNPYFDTGWYLDTHKVPPDFNPLLHYVLIGERQGLPPGPNFDPAWYAKRHRIGPGRSALAHYLAHRRTGLVSPLPDFDVEAYRLRHAARLQPGRDPFAHFLATRLN